MSAFSKEEMERIMANFRKEMENKVAKLEEETDEKVSRLEDEISTLRKENVELRAKTGEHKLQETIVFSGDPKDMVEEVKDFFDNGGPHPSGRLVVIADPETMLSPELLTLGMGAVPNLLADVHNPDLLSDKGMDWAAQKAIAKEVAAKVKKLAVKKNAFFVRAYPLPNAPAGGKSEEWKGATKVWDALDSVRKILTMIRLSQGTVSIDQLLMTTAVGMEEAYRVLLAIATTCILRKDAIKEVPASFVNELIARNTSLEEKREILRQANTDMGTAAAINNSSKARFSHDKTSAAKGAAGEK